MDPRHPSMTANATDRGPPQPDRSPRNAPDLTQVRSFAFERLDAMAAVLDERGVIVDTNEAWRLFAHLNGGSLRDTGRGVDYLDVCDRAASAGVATASSAGAGLRAILAGDRARLDLEYPCPSPTEDRWFLLRAAAAPVSNGAGLVLLHVDITSRKMVEERLADADHDGLTALPNWRAAVRVLDAHLTAQRRTGAAISVLLIRLDELASVTETYGDHVADQLLVQVAARAGRTAGATGTLTRLSGAEFALICPGLDDDDAQVMASRLRGVLAGPFQVGADEVLVKASIVLAPRAGDATAEALLAAAPRAPSRPAVEEGPGGGGTDLPARKARIDAIIANSSEVAMFFRADGTITWASPASSRVFGIEPHDLVGRNRLDLIHHADQARVRAAFASTSRLGQHATFEFRTLDRSGGVRWVEENLTNLLDEPRVGALVGTVRDISDRKAAEESMRFQGRLLAAVGQAVVATDTESTVIYWNDAAHATYGWTALEAIGKPIGEVLPVGEGWGPKAVEASADLAEGGSWSGEFLLRRKDGSTLPVMVTNTPVLDDDGRRIATIGVSSDISDRLRGSEAMARLSAIVESSNDAIFSKALDGTVMTWNRGAEALFGYTEADMVGRDVSTLGLPGSEVEFAGFLDRIGRGDLVKDVETVRRRSDGTDVHVSVCISPIVDTSGSIVGASTISRDVTQRVELQRCVEADRRRLADAQQTAHLGSFEVDLDTGEISRSDELCRILGVEPGDQTGALLDRVHAEDRAQVRQALEHAIAGRALVEVSHRIVRPNGEVRWVVSRTTPFRDPGSSTLSGTLLDVTERHEAEQALAHQATHDALTGLPNRAGLSDALASMFPPAGPPRPVAAALLDLDQFKVINDTLGHTVGDQALQAVAERLQTRLRPTDTVVRFGGDEFVLLREGAATFDEARELAEDAERALHEPVDVNGRLFRLTASIGVAVSDDSTCAESLISNADAAMYQAKSGGRARTAVFDEGARARAERRLDLETALGPALERGELCLEYQPIIDLATDEVSGFEALLRWDSPVHGRLPPDEFIPIAEANGLIIPIGGWVLETALGQLAAWRARPDVPVGLTMSVNLSASQLGHPGLVDRVAAAIAVTGVPARLVHLEITESVLMDRVDDAMDTVLALRDLGVLISIDDFGTGYSSLSYLNRLPIDTLKIDRSFVQGLRSGSQDSAIVLAISALADTLDLAVVAEGIEQPDQLDQLREVGCDYGQGFLWSPSLAPDQALRWMLTRADGRPRVSEG